ncbi:2OG-Fe(II) oxygenase [Planktothrix pseudagardhii]|uniref:PKHD-type hydroxylase sll0191 n=1 Tax=Planktothrix pseudagardhii TaxID=132604 RepID=A0A9W4CLJ9_9CYAN|nr:2OG-Fe(II) oxygenase [Planktothrix pseudagardhii]CAD5936439.1 putative PKHD-type hydroxylase sll0191 [Planktothrix pseudagardhii]
MNTIPPTHTLIPKDRLQNLINQSITTLETLLKDQKVSPSDRANIALKILEMTGGSSVTPLESLNLSSVSKGSAVSPLPAKTIEVLPTSAPIVAENNLTILPANYVQIENFLTLEENKEALKIALKQSSKFVASQTTTQASNYRKSSILYATLFPEFYEFLRKKLIATLPSILTQLNLSPFTISQVEMQLTAHNDSCFYKIHNDSGSPETNTRIISYVYYFYKEPKNFSGGNLRLYATEWQNGYALNEREFIDIEPHNNSIVFFDSRCKHEVMPVSCPSRRFEDGRFTLNGWLRAE